MSVRTTEHPHECPGCHARQECFTGLGVPVRGSFALCFQCFVWLVFEPPGVRLLRDAEWLVLVPAQREWMTRVRDEAMRARRGP